VWLSSERRHVSDVPPVMTPAEHAAMSAGPTPQDSPLDVQPPTAVIEIPEGGHVNPSSD
jgi:cell division protease FtsH